MSPANQSVVKLLTSSIVGFVSGDPPIGYILTVVFFAFGAIIGWLIVE